MSLPFFENESHPQQTRPMMIGVLVDQQDSCQFFGASWQRIPGSKRFEDQEWERRRSSVSEYYPYDLQITQCFRKELAAERDRGAVDPLVVYLDEFDEKLAQFLLRKRHDYHALLGEAEKDIFERLHGAQWVVWRGPHRYNVNYPDHIEFMCRGQFHI